MGNVRGAASTDPMRWIDGARASRQRHQLAITLKKRQRLAAPREVPASSCRYDNVCIDIPEKILIESHKPNGQSPIRRA
jgi:hypothetical protein